MSISCTDSSTDLDDQDRERNHLSHKIWDLVASVIKGLNQEKPNGSKFSTIPEESHKVELAANLAYQFVSPYDTGGLILGWDNTSPHPQMFRVIPGESFTTSDNAMALGIGEQYINPAVSDRLLSWGISTCLPTYNVTTQPSLLFRSFLW